MKNEKPEDKCCYHIAYAADENYASVAAVSIASLLENNKDASKIYIHFMRDNLSQNTSNKIKDIVDKYKREIKFYDIKSIIEKRIKDKVNPFGENKNLTAYARLFLTKILENDVEKILYLDCDTLILGSLKELFMLDFEDNIICAVKDIVPEYYSAQIGLDNKAIYINSGVLLIDVKEWNAQMLTEKIEDILNNKHPYFWYADQDIINIAFQNKIKIIDLKYNVLSINMIWNYSALKNLYEVPQAYYKKEEVNRVRKNPVIVHIVSNLYGRPWQGGQFMRLEWNKYLNMTEFADELKNKEIKVDSWKNKIIKVIYILFPQKIVSFFYGKILKKRMKKRFLKNA